MRAPIGRILVPVDFSEHAREALLYAVRLAEPLEADVDVLHVDAEADARSEHETLDDRAMQELEAFVRGVPVPIDVRLRTRVLRGDPAKVIVEESEVYDLVLMGTHGRTALVHLLMGSVTEKVFRHARCPVLVVQRREQAMTPLAAHPSLAPGRV